MSGLPPSGGETGATAPLQPVGNRPRNRFPEWLTATGNPRPGRGFRPPLPLPQPHMNRTLNRLATATANRFNRPRNRVKGEGPGDGPGLEGTRHPLTG